MNRLSAFSSPLLLGFDHFEQLLDRVAKSANDGYPPYNIERVATNGQSNGLRITLAVAGFARDDLQISAEANQLIIRGRQAEE
ncbi:MAG: heat-shock protein Hsp20, partial [Rhodospirillaceae bacterium]|nr:heat-shock protein Hsp20 [Rhodospirillaceae bacterium]